jgi:hypothetical protein
MYDLFMISFSVPNGGHHREAGFMADPVNAVVMQASFVF